MPAATTCASPTPPGPSGRPAAALLPAAAQPYLDTGLGHYLLLMAGIVPVLALILGACSTHDVKAGRRPPCVAPCGQLHQDLRRPAAAAGVLAWWMVLTQEAAASRRRSPTARPSC
jgi:hypothetical protein